MRSDDSLQVGVKAPTLECRAEARRYIGISRRVRGRPAVHSTGENHEGFLHFVVAAPQERGEKQNLATATAGVSPVCLIAPASAGARPPRVLVTAQNLRSGGRAKGRGATFRSELAPAMSFRFAGLRCGFPAKGL